MGVVKNVTGAVPSAVYLGVWVWWKVLEQSGLLSLTESSSVLHGNPTSVFVL